MLRNAPEEHKSQLNMANEIQQKMLEMPAVVGV
jgi:hypothetical protein